MVMMLPNLSFGWCSTSTLVLLEQRAKASNAVEDARLAQRVPENRRIAPQGFARSGAAQMGQALWRRVCEVVERYGG